jgi:hypothetical protein
MGTADAAITTEITATGWNARWGVSPERVTFDRDSEGCTRRELGRDLQPLGPVDHRWNMAPSDAFPRFVERTPLFEKEAPVCIATLITKASEPIRLHRSRFVSNLEGLSTGNHPTDCSVLKPGAQVELPEQGFGRNEPNARRDATEYVETPSTLLNAHGHADPPVLR